MSSAAQLHILESAPAQITGAKALGARTHYHHVEISDDAQAHLGDVNNYYYPYHQIQVNFGGTVSMIAAIVDIATKNITTLASIRSRYNAADLMVNLLSTQLTSVKTALDQIRMLVEESLHEDQHHQLVMNLDTAIKGCHLLLEVLDSHISTLENDGEHKTSFKNKVKLTLESNGVEQCLSRLDRQMLALNTIITAYSARESSRQQELMEEGRTQQIFEKVKDDTTSLYVLCDSASFGTRRIVTTTATSKLSLNFGFDNGLLQHRVYKAAFRHLLRGPRGRRKDVVNSNHAIQDVRHVNTTHETSSVSRVETLDKRPGGLDQGMPAVAEKHDDSLSGSPLDLGNHVSRPGYTAMTEPEKSDELSSYFKVVVIGKDAGILLAQLRLFSEYGYLQEKRRACRQAVESTLQAAAEHLSTQIKIGDIAYREDLQHELRVLMSTSLTIGPEHDLNPDLKERLSSWICYLNHRDAFESYLSDTDRYFLSNADRLFRSDCVPTAQDVVTESSIKGGIEAWNLEHGARKFAIRHSEGNMSPLQLLDHFMYNDGIIYTFDLAEHAEISSTGSISNDHLRSSIETFDLVVNSERARHLGIILLLCNPEALRQKLMNYPSALHFPAYTSDRDVYSIIHYIMEQFRQTIRQCVCPSKCGSNGMSASRIYGLSFKDICLCTRDYTFSQIPDLLEKTL